METNKDFAGTELTNVKPSDIQAAYSDKNPDENLDENGRLKHEDTIVFKIGHKDLIFMHETIRNVLEKGLVPTPEVGPVMTLLGDLASQEPDVFRKGIMILPVNYFVGLWHVLNTGRMFDIYRGFKTKDRYLDRLTKKVATEIDLYHQVKSHEANEEKADKNPNNYFKGVSNVHALQMVGETRKSVEEKIDDKNE